MEDKNNQNAAIKQMQPSKHVPQDEVIFERQECKNGLHTTLANYFSGSERYLILQSQFETLESYVEDSEEFNRTDLSVKLSLFKKNLKLLIGLEEFARPLFDKFSKCQLEDEKF